MTMRVLHVAPTLFGPGGLFGGGERYPLELARAVGRLDGVRSELVTFGARPGIVDADGVRVHVLRALGHLHGHPAHPLNPALFRVLDGADIVHTHHLYSAPSLAAAIAARVRGQRTVVTDHGLAGHGWFGLVPRLFDRFLTVSRYS